MKQDSYVMFINAQGNAVSVVIAWLGSVLGPIYIFLGWGDYSDWPLYVGLGLIFFVLYSIKKGFKALSRGVHSDFVAYGLIPILIPVITVVWIWGYNA